MPVLGLMLLLLGLLTYAILRRSVAGLTRTPLWLLWSVMMMPAFVWSAWILIAGEDRPMPVLLALAPFLICPPLYLWLVQRGRRKPPRQDAPPSDRLAANLATDRPTATVPETAPEKAPRLLAPEEEKQLRNCFPWSVYYLQHVDQNLQAVLCRGKLRAASDEAYRKIAGNIQAEFGDRFLVVFQESLRGEPFFALVPNPRSRDRLNVEGEQPLNRPGWLVGLLLLTLVTTANIGWQLAAVFENPATDFSNTEFTYELLLQGLPYTLGLMTILGAKELCHYSVAIAYEIHSTLPYFIPVPIAPGTFGAFVIMRSPIPNRRALFDVAIAGPLCGFAVTILILLWGLSLSQAVPLTEDSTILSINALDPRFSLLLTVFAKLTLGEHFSAGAAIQMHPLAVAGYVGWIVTALKLIPFGQLNGGNIVHAIYGIRTAAIVGQIARLLLLLLALAEPWFLAVAIVLFFLPSIGEPALDDVSELDDLRDAIGLTVLVLLLAMVLPMPQVLAQWLNV
ncbi:hypothetical protein KR51_00021280 [Rubidibacter lacunae KORDI 51-2]|uniref:Peptidase M50 domain-containing protein n=1 Tax=Rubidibacter lacunae KORDI 51-2 TaxID=582515 RepID=U5DNP2_9CHRO|nr:site-2 protease family protein [Rubidibacter lacunae]ERN41325.1 hypothetical protein KR51_00021280 [Rubidibacter lacunae KORDI 51-2]